MINYSSAPINIPLASGVRAPLTIEVDLPATQTIYFANVVGSPAGTITLDLVELVSRASLPLQYAYFPFRVLLDSSIVFTELFFRSISGTPETVQTLNTPFPYFSYPSRYSVEGPIEINSVPSTGPQRFADLPFTDEVLIESSSESVLLKKVSSDFQLSYISSETGLLVNFPFLSVQTQYATDSKALNSVYHTSLGNSFTCSVILNTDEAHAFIRSFSASPLIILYTPDFQNGVECSFSGTLNFQDTDPLYTISFTLTSLKKHILSI